jgi:hypothetical protein
MGNSSFVAEGNRNEFRITEFLLNLLEFFFTDNLKLNTDVSFVSSHPNIGLSFERFNGRQYSNAEMIFPEDEAFALSLVG